jgi:hypothetical protein
MPLPHRFRLPGGTSARPHQQGCSCWAVLADDHSGRYMTNWIDQLYICPSTHGRSTQAHARIGQMRAERVGRACVNRLRSIYRSQRDLMRPPAYGMQATGRLAARPPCPPSRGHYPTMRSITLLLRPSGKFRLHVVNQPAWAGTYTCKRTDSTPGSMGRFEVAF